MSLLPRIDRYLRHTATPPSTFGRRAINDPRLIFDLRNGRQLGVRVAKKVESFLAEAGW